MHKCERLIAEKCITSEYPQSCGGIKLSRILVFQRVYRFVVKEKEHSLAGFPHDINKQTLLKIRFKVMSLNFAFSR
jgi:hypothetical protein